MSKIIIHAGMPKAGSTAVQEWLEVEHMALRDRGIAVAVTEPTGRGAVPPIEVVTYEGGRRINSGVAIKLAHRNPELRAPVARELAAGLERVAASNDVTIMTSEALAQPFWKLDRLVLEELQGLTDRHEVVVAYYVRPQDAALEAAWRQWGFRSGRRPSDYIAERAEQLHYVETLEAVGEVAPGIDFTVRPFVRALLHSEDVVVDFATTFLDMVPDEVSSSGDANVGISLDAINLLAALPLNVVGDSMHDNRSFDPLKTLLAGSDTELSARALEGRAILHAWCESQFGEGNRRLAERLGFPLDDFWQPDAEPRDDLSALDAAWHPSASEAELEVVSRVLAAWREASGTTASATTPRRTGPAWSRAERIRAERDMYRRRARRASSELQALRARRLIHLARRVARLAAEVVRRASRRGR